MIPKPCGSRNGQFILIRRDAYEAVGGHASVAGDVLEDVALAARVKAAGYPTIGPSAAERESFVCECIAPCGDVGRLEKKSVLADGRESKAAREEIGRALLPILLVLSGGCNTLAVSPKSVCSLRVLLAWALTATGRFTGKNFRPCGFSKHLWGMEFWGKSCSRVSYGPSYWSHRGGRLEWKGREYPAGTPPPI